MKAKTIRNFPSIQSLAVGTNGIFHTEFADKLAFSPDEHPTWLMRMSPGKDVRLLDVPDHLYNRHDDAISGCYWADRILCPDADRRVYLKPDGSYAIRAVERDTHFADDLFVKRYGWVVAAYYDTVDGWQFCIESESEPLGSVGDTYKSDEWDELQNRKEDLLEDLWYMEDIIGASPLDIHNAEVALKHCEDRLAKIEAERQKASEYVLVQSDVEHILEMMSFDKIHTDFDPGHLIVLMGDGEYLEVWVCENSVAWINSTYVRLK